MLWAGAQALVKAVQTKRLISKYSHQNIVDNIRGSYEVDCSGFVNTVLVSQKLLGALQEIQDFTKTQEDPLLRPSDGQPWPLHYVHFLSSQRPKKYWLPIQDARSLEPGDIIAYTSSSAEKNPHTERGQHIMVVANFIRSTPESPSWVLVPIFDSTSKPHGKWDWRAQDGGIGEATIGLGLDTAGVPKRLKWHPERRVSWERNIIMARVIDHAD